MWTIKWVLLSSLALLSLAQHFEELDLSPEECKELGFNPATLKCASCKLLSQHNLETLISDCEKCCIKEAEKAHEVSKVF